MRLGDDQFGLTEGQTGIVGLGPIGPILLRELGQLHQAGQRGGLLAFRSRHVLVQHGRHAQGRRLRRRRALDLDVALLVVNDLARQRQALAELFLVERLAGERQLDAVDGLAGLGDAAGIGEPGLFGQLDGFVISVQRLLPIGIGGGGLAQRQGFVKVVDLGVASGGRQDLPPQQNQLLLEGAADLGAIGDDLQDAIGQFRLLRPAHLAGLGQHGLGHVQGDALVALGLLQPAIVLQPGHALGKELQRLLLLDDHQTKALDLREQRFQAGGGATLRRLRGVGQHLVIDVQRRGKVAQLLHRFAMPHVGVEPGDAAAILLVDVVEGLCRLLQPRRPLGTLRIEKGLGQIVVDQRQLELALVQIRFHALAGLRLGPIRSPGGRFAGAGKASSRAWNFPSDCWNFSRASPKPARASATSFSYCALSFVPSAFAERSESRAVLHHEVGP